MKSSVTLIRACVAMAVTTYTLFIFGVAVTPAIALLAAFGSLIPTIDSPRGFLGRFVKPLSRYIEDNFGHRSLTHSMLGMLIVGAITLPLSIMSRSGYLAIQIGMASHILWDMWGKAGVQFLYPYKGSVVAVTNRNFRFVTGSSSEAAAFAMTSMGFLALSILFMMVHQL